MCGSPEGSGRPPGPALMTGTGSPGLWARVEWVTVPGGLAAYVEGRRIATGDWDEAADVVRTHLSRLAAKSPDGVIRAEFEHEGSPLGTVLVTADGDVREAGPPGGDDESADQGAGADAPGQGTADERLGQGAPDERLGQATSDGRAPASRPVRPLEQSAPPGSLGQSTPADLAGAAHQSGPVGPRQVDTSPWAVDGDPAAAVVATLRRDAGPTPTTVPGRRPSAPSPPGPPPGGFEPARPATYRPATAPRAPSAPRGHRATPRPRTGRPAVALRPGRRMLVLGCVALACLLVVAALVAMISRDRPGVMLVRDETIGVPPPAEWQAKSMWRTPALLKDAGRVLMVDGTQMAFVTKDRTITLVDVERGEVRWSGRYPDAKPGTDLTATTIDGRRVVAAQVGDRLAWWDLESGEAHDLGLPAGASVSLQGSAPLVIGDQGRTAGTVAAGKLVTMPVPDGAKPLAARADGTVTATGAAGWWHLAAGRPAAQPTPWESPGNSGPPTIVGYLGDSVVTVLPTKTSGTAYVAVYSDRPQDVRFAWGGAAWFDGGSADWYPSPSRRWGILGRTLVDLTTARSMDLGAWTTQLVSADRALGMLARQRVLVGPQIPAGVLPDNEAFPEDLATTAAAVRAESGGDEYVYLLPPKATP
jgi:hypothetical protein